MNFDEAALAELAASIREHGVLQPVLVRPTGELHHFQLVAGERRWRAAHAAGLTDIPALIEDLDDETAMEIGIIENLQREDLSPLEEALIYDRMTHDHGYSVRKLAQKLGKDKGYIENRLRLAGAPTEIKQLVSLRKDTVSHAYELLKVEDPKKRRRLAEQVASGELSLVKLREKIEGRPPAPAAAERATDAPATEAAADDEQMLAPQDASRRGAGGRRIGVGQAQPGRGAPGVGGCAGLARDAAPDRRDGPRQPGQVPDHRQAAPRERDHRRRAAAGQATRRRPTTSPAQAGRSRRPEASSRIRAH